MICWACQSNVGEVLDRCPYCGAVAKQDTNDPLVGRELGVYRLLRRIGQGGMGVVYEAHHVKLEVSYALKVLHPSLGQDWVMVERLRREAVVAFQLQHQNIVRVLDYGWDEALGFYLVMEMLRGEGLNTLLVRRPVLPLLHAAQIVYQVCEALEVAHYNGVVHRDLKPGNVFLVKDLDEREQVKLLDFGIARLSDPSGQNELTRAGRSFGTPAYMPPEQILSRSDEIGPATDIYALASMLYRMLTGVLAFKGNGLVDTLNQVMVRPTPLISQIRSGLQGTYLESMLLRCMDKQVSRRIPTAREFSQELRKAIEEDPAIRDFLRNDEAEKMVLQHDSGVALETVALDVGQSESPSNGGVKEGQTFIFAGEAFQFDGKELVAAAQSTPQSSVGTWGREGQAAGQAEVGSGQARDKWLEQQLPTMLLTQGKPSEQLRESIAELASEKLNRDNDSTLIKLSRPPGREYTPPSKRWLQGPIAKPSMPPKPRKPKPSAIEKPKEAEAAAIEVPAVDKRKPLGRPSWRWIGLRVGGGFLVGFVVIGSFLLFHQWWKSRSATPEPNHQWTQSALKQQHNPAVGLKSKFYYLTVESVPSRARIIEQGKVLGTTPLTIRRNVGQALNFVVEKKGFEMSAGSWAARHDRRMKFSLTRSEAHGQ